MEADGNCLFHSMAHTLGWADFRAVKSDLLRFLPAYRRHYDPDNNLIGPYANYLRHALRTEGEWGDYEHIRIFARRHHYTVTVHRPDDHRWPIRCRSTGTLMSVHATPQSYSGPRQGACSCTPERASERVVAS